MPEEYYAKELEVSVSDLNGAIKVLAGTSVAKFIEDYSLEMAKYMLAHSKSEIRAVAQRCGYSPSGLFRVFRRRFKMSPEDWRWNYRIS